MRSERSDLRYFPLIPRWTQLTRIGRSRTLRSSYVWLFVVPIAAILLEKIGTERNLPLWNSTLTLTLGLPFSWTLFYYSAVAFAIASFLYSACCPPIIRDYDHFAGFRAEGKTAMQIIFAFLGITWPSVGSSFRKSKHVEATKQFVEEFASNRNHILDKVDGSPGLSDKREYWHHKLPEMEIQEKDFANVFWYVYHRAETNGPLRRAVCSLMYLVGFALIIVVIVQNFLSVWRVTTWNNPLSPIF